MNYEILDNPFLTERDRVELAINYHVSDLNREISMQILNQNQAVSFIQMSADSFSNFLYSRYSGKKLETKVFVDPYNRLILDYPNLNEFLAQFKGN